MVEPNRRVIDSESAAIPQVAAQPGGASPSDALSKLNDEFAQDVASSLLTAWEAEQGRLDRESQSS